MKKRVHKFYFLTVVLFLLLCNFSCGAEWLSKATFSKVFIENKGQYSEKAGIPHKDVHYMAEFGPQLYFTSSGILFSMSKGEKLTEEEKRKRLKLKDGRMEMDEEKPKTIIHTFFMNMEWVGANPNVKLVVEEKVQEYWNFLDPGDRKRSIDRVSGFKKLTYKDLYPNIDVEYVFHPSEGLKYSLILHPGADASLVKMKYINAKSINKDREGNICYSTDAGSITDHAPETFYFQGGKPISSKFNLNDNIVTFELGPYDRSRKIVIDPWMNSTLVPSNTPVDLGVDASNNVYVYGFVGLQSGSNPVSITHYVQKYNAAGTLQWTFNFTNAMNYIQNTGDIAVDPAGNSYVSCGFYFISFFIFDCMQSKLDPAGSLVWNLQSPFLYENWRNSFNCDYTQLVQVGVGPGCCDVGHGDIINTTTGAETGVFNPPNTGDIVASSYGKNGYLYILSVVDQASNPPPQTPNLTCLDPANAFSVVFSLAYPVGPNFIDGFNTNYGTYGFNGLVAGCNFLYVCLGATLEKRDLNTGSLIGSVPVPGGVLHGNAGTAVDNCGNVYVGSSKGVEVFDPSLNQITSFATPQPVFDIVIGAGGMFYACGGINTTNTNVGFVAQFSMSSVCNPTAITTTPNSCGSSNIGTATATPLFCTGPYTYSWSTSPVQTTQTATGLAGGSYTVIVTGSGVCNDKDTAVATIPSGLLVVTVPPYVNVSCSGGNNGSASIASTGGTSPYTYAWNPTGQTTSTATGLSAGTYSVTVTDGVGCSGTQTVTITQPAPLTATVSSTAAACGGNNGSAAVSVAGGTIGYSYTWNPSGQSTQSASNLSSGNYLVTVSDANGCTATQTVAVASTGSITAVAGPNSTVCSGQSVTLNASGGTSYSWSSGQTTASIVVAAVSSSTYSVMVSTGSCSDTAFVPVTVIPSPTVSISGNVTVCGGSAATLVASGGVNYFWNTGSSASSIIVSPSVTTTYTVFTANGSCSSAAATTVFVASSLVAGCNSATICSGQTALLTASGGGNYVWSTGSTLNPVSVSPTATTTYSVVVTAGTCSAMATATVVVYPTTSVSAWSNTTITAGSAATITATGGSSYSWSNGETSDIITVSPSVTTVYCVISGSGSCADTSCVTVFVEPVDNCNYAEDQLFVPDAFSPNGDSKNDVLGIYFPDPSCIKELEFIIYDRWGEKVFEATTITATWDGSYKGKLMNTAVFVYYMKVSFLTNVETIRKGNISLIR